MYNMGKICVYIILSKSCIEVNTFFRVGYGSRAHFSFPTLSGVRNILFANVKVSHYHFVHKPDISYILYTKVYSITAVD